MKIFKFLLIMSAAAGVTAAMLYDGDRISTGQAVVTLVIAYILFFASFAAIYGKSKTPKSGNSTGA